MNPDLEKLLSPISDSEPCGPDLGLDPLFDDIENLLKGTPEVDLGSYTKPGEPPDWRALQKKTIEFLEKSRHLRPALILVGCLLRTRGITGYRDGVQYVRSLVENNWPTLHPLLDPDDDNDPTRRLNQLSTLTQPRGAVSGWLTLSEYLHTTPLCRPPGTTGITYDEILQAQQSANGLNPDTPTGKALRAAPAEEIVETHTALGEALEAIRGIDTFLTNTLGAGGTISFEDGTRLLAEMQKCLQPFLPASAAAASDAPADSADSSGSDGQSTSEVAAPAAGAGTFVISGSIRSREGVLQALEAVCDYYRQVEPGSPVPFIIRRAQKMVTMNFVEVMQELSLATAETLKPSMGSALDQPPAA